MTINSKLDYEIAIVSKYLNYLFQHDIEYVSYKKYWIWVPDRDKLLNTLYL